MPGTRWSDRYRIKSLFLDTLRLYDGESIDLQGFLRDLNNQLGRILDLHPSSVTVEIEALLHGRIAPPAPQEPPGLSPEALVKKYKDTAPPGVQGTCDTPPAYSHTGNEIQASGTGKRQSASAVKDKQKSGQGLRNGPVVSVAGGADAHVNGDNTEENLLGKVHVLAKIYGIDIIYLTPEERGGSVILFGVAPLDRALIPGEDEELGAVWWALTKYSLSFLSDGQTRYGGFIQKIETMFRQYFVKLEGPLGTLLLFEQTILCCQPKIRDQLHEIQHLCGLMIEEIATGK